MPKPAAYLMVSVLLLGLFLMRESREGFGARIESGYWDWIAANSARTVPPARVALVEIDDSSLASEHAWPWSPLEYALFLRVALRFQPAVVAIEPVLNWQNAPVAGESRQKMEQSRAVLHDCVLQAPKLVLGSELGSPDDSDMATPILPAPLLRNVTGDTRSIPLFADIPLQPEEDYRLSAAVGFTNLPPPNQGEIIHKMPLLFNYRGEIVPSFVLQTLIQWFKLTPDDVKVEAGPRNARIELGKTAVIPIDGEGRMNVDFSSTFTRFGEDDLLLAVSEKQPGGKTPQAIDTSALKGSIALLARTDADSRTLLVPSLARESQGEIAAAAIATVLNQAFSRRVPAIFDFAVIAVMMALACVFLRFRKPRFALLSFVALLCYLFLCMSVYSLSLVRLPFLLPAGLLLLVNFFSIFIPRDEPAPAGPAQGPS